MEKTFVGVSPEDEAKYGPSRYNEMMKNAGYTQVDATGSVVQGRLSNVDDFIERARKKFKKK